MDIYGGLKILFKRVQENEEDNKMGVQNLSVVWGPNLLYPKNNDLNKSSGDFRLQAKVVETILANYIAIFD